MLSVSSRPRFVGAIHAERLHAPTHSSTPPPPVPLRLAALAIALGAWRPTRRRTAVRSALSELREVEGDLVAELPPGRLEPLRKEFPTLDLTTPGLRLVSEDPPVFVLRDVLTPDECAGFIDAMRLKDGSFPERLGQSDLPSLPSWLSPVRNVLQGVPVLEWLGNPTVRWTYRSRDLLDRMVKKVQQVSGLDLQTGAANVKHYRKDQWLPVHIDYNKATLLVYLNDLAEGGHTLFPTLGIKVRPPKGSGLVWPNQPPLKHAGDRVLDGEKWVLFYNWPGVQNWDGSIEVDLE